MPRWEITIADIYTRVEEAPTRDDAIALAKDDNEAQEYDDQRVLRVIRLDDEP